MARNFAQLSIDLWSRDEWRALSPEAQHLYLFLMSHPSTTFAGVTDWRPTKMRGFASGWSEEAIDRAAHELAAARLLVVDLEFEEALVVGYIGGQGLLKQPRLAVSIVKAHGATASTTIRGVIISELTRAMNHRPDLQCWSDERVLRLLEQPSLDIENVAPDFGATSGMPRGLFGPNSGERLGAA